MKSNDIKALHEKKIDQLLTEVGKLEVELSKARLEKKAFRLKDVSKTVRLADDVARYKTIIGEKQAASQTESNKTEQKGNK